MPAADGGDHGSGLERLAGHITVREQNTAAGRRTAVRINHRVSPRGLFGRRARWLNTTSGQRLTAQLFGWQAEKINRAASEKGRGLYCVDLERDTVIAALSYHVPDDPQVPLSVTALGLRRDDAALYAQSIAQLWQLKRYVHALALHRLGRPGQVIYDARRLDDREELGRLGFRHGPRLRGQRASGEVFVQDAE